MKAVALISGGKDSCYNMMQCIAAGHEIVALANLTPETQTELDSFMYQSVGYEAIDFIASAMDLPLFKKITSGKSSQRDRNYEPTNGDEVEDLYNLLKEVKETIEIEAVSVGAILSDYQRIRVENVCVRLNLTPLAYLWQRDQDDLLDEMIKCEIDAIIIKVATLGLEPSKHLGRTLSLLQPHLHAMHEKYGLNVCGEGGEYETLTLDCPLFKSRIVIEDSEIVIHSDDAIAPVGYLKLNKLRLEIKMPELSLSERLAGLPLKDSDGYITDHCEEAGEFIEDENSEESECINDGGTCEEANMNAVSESLKPMHFKQEVVWRKSIQGWLWIGGLQGDSAIPQVAMEQAMDKLKSILSQNSQTIADVCSISMFISDMKQYTDLNHWYCKTFDHTDPPTRACVQVPLNENCPITIEALSWSQPIDVSGDQIIDKYTMHVQSRSHWAPANIGPYSQLVRIEDLIHLAGQIGLVPGSLELVKGGIKAQCQLALRNIGRLLKAVDSNVNLRDVVQGICYLRNVSHVEHARKQWEEKTNNAIVDYVVVTDLPKSALVEWHVWAHKHNNQFEYEETGKCIDSWHVSIYRRWNYENNIAAIVCHVDNSDENLLLTGDILVEVTDYVVQKLNQGHEDMAASICSFKIFHPVDKNIEIEEYNDHLKKISANSSLVYTIVPVVCLKSKNTFLSICGVRYQ